MLLEGPGGWGGAQQGPRAGVGRGWGGALGLIKLQRSQAGPLVWKGEALEACCVLGPQLCDRARPGDPRIQCLTHRTQQGVGVTRVS